MKCVPLKVERKLYSATLLLAFSTVNRSVQRGPDSLWNRLSVPTPISKRLCGFTRSGLWSSFSVPDCGSVSNVDVPVPLQVRMGDVSVAATLLQANPTSTCSDGVSVKADATSGTPLTTSPLSKRQVKSIHSSFLWR